MSATLQERKDALVSLREDISRTSRVSPDTAIRMGAASSALSRSIETEETGKIFLSGSGARGVLILGIGSLRAEDRARVVGMSGGRKSASNYTLESLDGLRGEIRANSAGTCWVIDLASPRGVMMFAWSAQTSGCGRSAKLAGPRLPVTNGGGHWVGLLSTTAPISAEEAPLTVKFIQSAVETLARTGRTPMQQQAWENAERATLSARKSAAGAAVSAAITETGTEPRLRGHWGDLTTWGEDLMARAMGGADCAALVAHIRAEQSAAEDARLMAELVAEELATSARLAAERAESARIAAMTATIRAVGVTQSQWDLMTPKGQGLAVHRARLAGKI